MGRASAAETVEVGSVCGRVKPTTMKLDIHSFLAWRLSTKGWSLYCKGTQLVFSKGPDMADEKSFGPEKVLTIIWWPKSNWRPKKGLHCKFTDQKAIEDQKMVISRLGEDFALQVLKTNSQFRSKEEWKSEFSPIVGCGSNLPLRRFGFGPQSASWVAMLYRVWETGGRVAVWLEDREVPLRSPVQGNTLNK